MLYDRDGGKRGAYSKPSFLFLRQFQFTFRYKLKFLMVLDKGDKGGNGVERL